MNGPPWYSMRDLLADEEAYRCTWWRSDPLVTDACQRDPTLAARLEVMPRPVTVDVFRRPDFSYDDERAGVHRAIVAQQVAGGTPPTTPTVYFTIGCMGAGKSSYLRRLVHGHRMLTSGQPAASLSRVAADDVRGALPGYGGGLGSRVVEAECFDVTYNVPNSVFAATRDAGFDIVYDTLGTILGDGTVSFEPQLRELREAGYRVQLLRAHAPLFACIDRAEQRALATGRTVKADDQRAVYNHPPLAEERLRAEGLLDGWLSVDTFKSSATAAIIEASDEWSNLHPQLQSFLARP